MKARSVGKKVIAFIAVCIYICSASVNACAQLQVSTLASPVDAVETRKSFTKNPLVLLSIFSGWSRGAQSIEQFKRNLTYDYVSTGSFSAHHDRVLGARYKHRTQANTALFIYEHLGSKGEPKIAADTHVSVTDMMLEECGFPHGIEDDAVYAFREIWDSVEGRLQQKRAKDVVFVTGYEIRNLGLSPRMPILSHTSVVYELKRIQVAQPKSGSLVFSQVLADSLYRYRKYGREDRIAHSFAAQTLIDILGKKDMDGFTQWFSSAAQGIQDNKYIYAGDLARLFFECVELHPDLRDQLYAMLRVICLSEKPIALFINELAANMINAVDVGEIVIFSPESKETSGTGGLATYTTEYAQELARQGFCVTVVVPMFVPDKEHIFKTVKPHDTGHAEVVKFSNKVEGSLEDAVFKIYEAHVLTSKDKSSTAVRMLFLEQDKYFSSLKGGIDSAYGNGQKQRRFMRMLSLGGLLAVREMNIYSSVIQTTDWPTSLTKAYLEGRERVDDRVKNDVLKKDMHFMKTLILSIGHQLHKGYQGRMFPSTDDERDEWLYHDLGLAREMDLDIVVDKEAGLWRIINPLILAALTSDFFRTVSPGYLQRILDINHNDEFGGLVQIMQFLYAQGVLDGEANGFEMVDKQKQYFPSLEKAFCEMGHDEERRRVFDDLHKNVMPQKKAELQELFGLPVDPQAFVHTMLHRTGSQKGHQLMLADVWDRDNPGMLKACGGLFEGMEDTTHSLSEAEKAKLVAYANTHGRKNLRALEVVCILQDNVQFVIAGSVESEFYREGFFQISENFPQKVKFINEFIKHDDDCGGVNRHLLLMSGSDSFGQPSQNEPCGISDMEARAAGVPCLVTERDGLAARIIRVMRKDGTEFAEGFSVFNPVAWFEKYEDFRSLYVDDPVAYSELRYQAISQDNRWLAHVWDYVERFRMMQGKEPIPGMHAFRVSAAINRARFRGDHDPADELMRTGYTIEKARNIVLDAYEQGWDRYYPDAEVLRKHLEILNSLAPDKKNPVFYFLKSA